MFNIDAQYSIKSDLPIITDSYEVLHFDEFPILFEGKNLQGSRVVGSLICDDEAGLFHYFHAIIEDKNYIDFKNQWVSYLNLLKNADSIFVLGKDINGMLKNTYQLPFNKIPKDYLPLPTAYCPKSKTASNLDKLAHA